MTDQQPHTSNQHADHTSHIEDTENYENSISPKSQCEGAKDEEDDGLEFSGFNDVAFYCMPQSNKLRRACLHIITSPWFEKTVILVILLNCLTLGMYQPCLDAKGCTTTRCRVLSVFDNVIYAFFLLEMVVKVIAMGFVGKKAYLDEAWNRLDLFIIIAGTGELISSAAAEYGLANGEINLSAIRTIRVLRPLRAINRIPNLRILVMLLLDTLPMLGNVLLMCFFVFFIFGILGVQLWAGKLRQRCFMSKEMNKLISNITTEYNISKPTSDYYEGLWSSLDFICSTGEDAGMLKCTDIEPLVVNDTPCTLNLTEATYGYLSPNFTSPDNYSCINWNQYYTDCKPEGPNPFQEAISFDNIASAWIAIFQVISLEGWVDIMYYLQDTHSYWVWIYFLALIVIGAFFMVNLFLVVIATQFSETKRRETDKINEERKRYKSSTTLTSNRTESDGCYNQLLTYFIHVVKHTKRKLTRKYYAWWQRNHKDHDGDTSEADIKLNLFGNHIHCHPCEHMMALVETCNAPIASPEPSDIDSMSYYSNIQRIFGQSPASRRSSRVEPLIRIYPEPTVGETSFTAPISSNHRSLQNGSLQVIVDANDCPENMALLRVVQSHKPLAGTYSLGSRPNSNHSSPQPSPILARRDKGSPAPLSPTPAASSNGHLPLRRSRSNGDRPMMTNNNDSLTIPNVTRFPPLRSLSNHLQVPNNDMNGSIHSLLSHQSSISNTSSKNNQVTLLTPYDMCHKSVSRRSSYMSSNGKSVIVPNLPADGGKRFSFSMLSYMNGGCDMNCSKCQHLCVEVKRREASKVRKEEKEKGCCSKLIAFWDNDKVTKARATMKKWVDGAIFRFFILGAILVNTVTMGIEHHNQPPLMTLVVEVFNYIFIAVFTIEMVVKLIADGFYAYIKDTLCVFDGFIVIMSFVELASGEENSGLSVLRTFRLLRILKLIRFMPALQKQFLVMVRTMDNVASFFGLLMLFMFIFSVLGMNLFGCLLKSRRNFNSLLWSLITVFQILTQEDWNIIMYDGMSTTSPWAALYFVALMTIGNYVLFNLLVAILVEGFSSVTQDRLVTKILKQLKRDRQLRGESSSVPAEELEAAVLKHEIDMVQQVESGGGAVLPSIITDHPEASNQNLDTNLGPNQNLDTNLGLTPIITRTEATPRGSPKSEIEVPIFTSRFPSIDEPQVVLDTSSISSWNPFANASPRPVRHSRSRSIKSTSTSPRFSRKGSRNSRHSSRHDISEDKVMLMDEDDQSQDDVFSFADSQCRINSIKNFDLLQVPAVTDFHHSSDQISVKSDNVTTKQNGSLSPLTILIPDNHSSCNGSVHHNSLGLKHLGEQTPLLTALCEDAAGGDGKALRERWRKTHLLRNNVISSVDTDDSHKSPAKSPANIIPTTFSNPVQENGVSRDYPYSDTEKGDAQDTREEKESKTIYQRVVHFCRPRGCFLQRADYSLYLFSPTNRFRRFCTSISTKKWFDYSVLVLIGLNCIALAVERPSIPPESLERKILMYANYSFTFLFLLEMIIKVTAQGFVIGPTTYLKNGWNINDGFLVVVSMIDCFITWSFATSPKIFGVLRVLRLLRALRPLRVISRAPGLKLVVETLLSSLRPIGNIVLICLTFYLIFGILGVQLFKGTFYHCVGENLTNITNKDQCHEHGYKWENEKYNFDHLGSALMSLFVLSSKDGWVMIMYTGLDAVGIDQQPQENYSEWRLLYFISFLLLVGFFVLNMFVGVVVENFHRCREVHEKEEREKREQRRQKKLAKKMANKKKALGILVDAENEETAPNISNPTEFNETDIDDERNEPPYWTSYGPRRLVFHNLVTNKYFDIAVSIIIFLNVISMAVEHYQMSNEMVFALKVLNYVFTFIFILEAIFKMVALGFVRYIKERWNQLDVLIVLLSLLGIAMEEIETGVMPINPTIIRVMRMLRIARVLKLLKMAKGIRALLDTVLVALPQVGNLGLLFFLLFFIFAALGVELFGRIECSEEHPCEGMGVHANFEDSGAAFLTLFRIATGDNWNGIMKDALREDCDSSENCSKNCCVNTIITPIYFVIFVLTAQFVLVNVVVAVLMKHLEDANFSADKILYSRRLALTNEDGQDLTNQQVTTSTQSRLNYSHPSTLDDRENIQVHQDSERESCLLSGDELDASTKELDNNHIDAATDKELEKDQNEVNDTESDDALHLKPLHRQRSLPPNFRLSLEMIT